MTPASELNVLTAEVLDLVSATKEDIAFDAQVDELLIGQKNAKAMLRRINRAYRSKLRDTTRPIYKAMLVGKSHVGKTETARTLAQLYHNDPDAFVKINCETFADKGDTTRLVGSGPKWVGYDDPRKNLDNSEYNPAALLSRVNLELSKKGSKAPVVIILFDEIEKAKCEEFAPFLLKMLDTGKIVLGNNVEVDLCDCIILMTSNIGMQEFEANAAKNPIGFTRSVSVETDELTDHVNAALKAHYPPEFLNRLEETVIYTSLTNEELRLVVELEIRRLEKRISASLGERGFNLTVESTATDWLRDQAVLATGDAAELKRAFPRNMTDPLSEGVNRGLIGPGDQVIVSVNEGKTALEFRRIKNPNQVEMAEEATAVEAPKMLARHREALDLVRAGNAERGKNNLLQARVHYSEANNKLNVEHFADHPLISTVFNQSGLVEYVEKRYDKALEFFEFALRVRKMSLTKKNWSDGGQMPLLYTNVVTALVKLNRVDEAKAKLEESIGVLREFYPGTDDDGWLAGLLSTYVDVFPEKKNELFKIALELGLRK